MKTVLVGGALRALTAFFLTASLAGPALAVVEVAADAAPDTTVRTTQETRARAKASPMGRSMGLVLPGQEYTRLSRSGAWSQVTDGSKVAWIRSAALEVVEVQEAAAAQPAPAFAPVPAGSEPAEDLPAPGSEPGEVVRVSLVKVPPARSAGPDPSTPPDRSRSAPPLAGDRQPLLVGTVASSLGRPYEGAWQQSPRVLGLRGSPSFAEGIIGVVNERSSVRVLERHGSWGRVESRDGRGGWIVLAALDGPLRSRR